MHTRDSISAMADTAHHTKEPMRPRAGRRFRLHRKNGK